jgi:predicted dehydrogenase
MSIDIDLKRRALLKKVSLITGSAVLAGSLPWLQNLGAEEKSRSLSKIRFAIIGVGSRGSLHLDVLKMVPDAELAAVCDDYPPNLEIAKAKAGNNAKTYSNYHDVLNNPDIDAVIIATPPYTHAEITIASFKAGKHVLCEKAMSIHIEECIEMIRAQKQYGLCLQIGHQRMFNPRYISALQQIKEGKIGRITQIRAFWHRNNNWRKQVPSWDLDRKINWRLYLDYSRGLMTELASHHIQVSNWYMGGHPDYVVGSGSINYWKDGREVFDNVNVIYHYPNDVHMIYDSLVSNVHHGLELQIMGDRGTLEMEKGIVYTENPSAPNGFVKLVEDTEKKFFSTVPIGGASWVPDHSVDAKGQPIIDFTPEDENILQIIGFIDSIRKNKPCIELLRDSYHASIACLMGHEAMATKYTFYWKKEWDFDSL